MSAQVINKSKIIEAVKSSKFVWGARALEAIAPITSDISASESDNFGTDQDNTLPWTELVALEIKKNGVSNLALAKFFVHIYNFAMPEKRLPIPCRGDNKLEEFIRRYPEEMKCAIRCFGLDSVEDLFEH